MFEKNFQWNKAIFISNLSINSSQREKSSNVVKVMIKVKKQQKRGIFGKQASTLASKKSISMENVHCLPEKRAFSHSLAKKRGC
jgi:hypothetical protein